MCRQPTTTGSWKRRFKVASSELLPIVSSTRSSRRSPTAWAWGSRSADQSSTPMAVASGYRRACCAAPSSVSLWRAYHQGLTVEPEEISHRHEILRAVLVPGQRISRASVLWAPVVDSYNAEWPNRVWTGSHRPKPTSLQTPSSQRDGALWSQPQLA
jgi:hypothetical protein